LDLTPLREFLGKMTNLFCLGLGACGSAGAEAATRASSRQTRSSMAIRRRRRQVNDSSGTSTAKSAARSLCYHFSLRQYLAIPPKPFVCRSVTHLKRKLRGNPGDNCSRKQIMYALSLVEHARVDAHQCDRVALVAN
jgi:hypothetical protein